jgi:hypothetical protein
MRFFDKLIRSFEFRGLRGTSAILLTAQVITVDKNLIGICESVSISDTTIHDNKFLINSSIKKHSECGDVAII